jgi:hypothetical protein
MGNSARRRRKENDTRKVTQFWNMNRESHVDLGQVCWTSYVWCP